jgi:DNA-binding protein YbaB
VRTIVLAFGKPAPQQSGAGDGFSRITTSAQLAGGVLQLSSLTFESPDVSLAGRGTLSLSAGSVDVTGKAMLSEALTKQAGTDLVRFTGENGRVTVPVTVSGAISDPKVGVDVGDMARRAATNEAKTQIKKQTDSLLNRFTGKKKP